VPKTCSGIFVSRQKVALEKPGKGKGLKFDETGEGGTTILVCNYAKCTYGVITA
jgi:hypothetical protein